MLMVENRKIYTSFHDIPPREYMYFPRGTLDTGKPGKFSSTEILHLTIAIGVLTIAFSFALSENNIRQGFNNVDELVMSFPMSFLGVITAFFVHELLHKFMAQKHGLWAEFRMYTMGLALALVLSFLVGFVFAAPGAVMFGGGSRDYETGRIAVAGPLSNMVIAVVSFILYLLFFFEAPSILGKTIGFICLINAFLASFNLLPLGPLDGLKVIKWNLSIWMTVFSVSIAITTITFIKIQLI
jgi:Zn-dependent protease